MARVTQRDVVRAGFWYVKRQPNDLSLHFILSAGLASAIFNLLKKKKNRNRKRPQRLVQPSGVSRSASKPKPQALLVQPNEGWLRSQFAIGASLFLLALIYSFWPTLQWIVGAWNSQPDYSHGYLVIPLALTILAHRIGLFRGIAIKPSYAGLSLLVLSIAMRVAAAMVYAEFLDAWAILPLIAGAIWFLLGWHAMVWSLPAVFFLLFMFPLPYQAESILSWKLQGVATSLSTVFLQVLGQPAVSEGHVIWLLDEPLEVEEACSGLRIFIGVAAAAYFWAVMADRSWIDRVVIVLAFVPVALLANALRITVMGLIYVWFAGEDVRHWAHDFSGLAMIPVAFGMLWLVKWFWQNLYRPIHRVTAGDMITAEGT